MHTRMVLATLLRHAGQARGAIPRASTLPSRRGMADAFIPKPDTSMDHVFGDSSVRLPHDFQPPSITKTFLGTVTALGLFLWPVWIMAYEDYKMSSFLER